MSKKHFDEYYDKVYKSYLSISKAYEAYQKECQEKMLSPDVLKQMEQTLRPVKESFNNLQYIKYLLDMPEKGSKQERYSNQNKKVLASLDGKYTAATIEKNNKAIIDKAKDDIK